MDWDVKVGDAEDVRWVFETMPVMLAALRGPDHRLIALNDAYRQLIPKAEATGRPVREVFPEVLGQFVFDAFDRVYQTGETHHGKEWRIAIDLDDSGATRDVYWDFTFAARRDDSGDIDGIDLVLQDVTPRVRARLEAEAKLAEMSELYEQVRTSANVMQQALLARSVPVVPGADVAAEYLVAAEDTAAGGDWFDAIATDDGALLMIVGDVVGHGVEAAAVMAQLRTAIRMELLQGTSLGAALVAVDRFSSSVAGAKFATICVARLDVASGAFEYATAGHPPPLLIAGGETRFLMTTGGSPLGNGNSYDTLSETLDVGDAVLLYTDGIVERPGRPLSASTTEFATVAIRVLAGQAIPDHSLRPIERLCTQTLELLLRDTGYADDVTLLAVQRTSPQEPLHLSVPADDDATPDVRLSLRDWMTSVGASRVDVMIVEHAVSEFVQNCADHAYDTDDGHVTVAATLSNDGTLNATVTDTGRWKPVTRQHDPGRGLSLVSTLIGTTRINHDDTGTQAELTYRLTRPARIVTDPTVVHVVPRTQQDNNFRIEVLDGDHGADRLIVHGDVDAAHAPVLAGQITGLSYSSTTPLSVDLTGVTHLGSSALRVLAEARDAADEQNTGLTFIAPPGSTAHHVLSLVGLSTS